MPAPTIKGTDFLQSDTGTVLTVNPGNAVANDIVLFVSYVDDGWTGPTTEKGTWTLVDSFNDTAGMRTEAWISKVTDVGPYSFIYSGANATAWGYAVAMTTIDDPTISVGGSQSTQRGPAIAPSVNASALSGRLFYIAPKYRGDPNGGAPINANAIPLAKVIASDTDEFIQFYSGEQLASGASGTSQNGASGGGGDRYPAMHVWVPPSPSIEVISPFGVVTLVAETRITEVQQPSHEGAVAPSSELFMTPSIVLEGSITPTATKALQQLETEDMTGSVGPVGSLSLMPMLSFAGAVGPQGQRDTDEAGSLVGGAVTPFATLQFTVLEVREFDGQVTPVGTLNLMAIVDVDGSITPLRTISYATHLEFDGSIDPTGELELLPHMVFEGSITPTGTGSTQQLELILLEGSVSFSSELGNSVTIPFAGSIFPYGLLEHNVGVELAGSITPVGVTVMREPEQVEEDGAVTPVGEVTFLVEADKDEIFGRITPNATLAIMPIVEKVGIVGPTGELVLTPSIELNGSIDPSGTVALISSLAQQIEGEIGPVGTLRNDVVLQFEGSTEPIGDFYLTVPLTFEGQITPFGAMASEVIRVLRLHTTLNVSGDLALDPSVLLAGSVGPYGDVNFDPELLLEGSITPSGVLTPILSEAQKWRSPKWKDFRRATEKRMQR